MKQAAIELAALFGALALVPLGPPLALAYAGAPWQAVALGGAWAACWFVWLAARLRREPQEAK
ncbi:MAG: hypothetical protein OXI25_01005 [Chloroflexota bacterium]|nr:hypothetical protein [Chloroflexota bacterium]